MNDNQLRCWLLQAKFKVSDPLQACLNGTISNAVTPLMHAARLGDADILEALLSRGADPALLNADGNGALWFACFSNSAACLNALIVAGAPLDSQNVNGATALIYCASAGKTPLVRLLLDAGARTDLMTLDDFTALELAGNLDCLKMLKAVRPITRLPFTVSSSRHCAFGQQVVVRFADDFVLKLTQAEASSLSLALVAVRDGLSSEREIYMSPIASDAAFAGSVHDRGMSIATSSGALELDWSGVGLFATAMAVAIDGC